MNEHVSYALRLAPVIERVHGAGHPELTRVRELTQQLAQSADATETANLFRELREVTSDFVIPGDACEAFTSTYQSLEAADVAFRAGV
jgi:regulator of cell morphogenesis and NO signaling